MASYGDVYSSDDIAEKNRQAVALVDDLRQEYCERISVMVISGCVGPRSDGYHPNEFMTITEAMDYHSAQIDTFSHTRADMISAVTLTYCEEAIGIVKAAQALAMPVVISFTVETHGQLPSGQSLKQAIVAVDEATNHYPAYYMINCAHPTHFEGALVPGEPWLDRIRGIRANASRLSHIELDDALVLDDGSPQQLGRDYQVLANRLKNLNVFGGCCGTDHRHVTEIIKAITLAGNG